MAWARVLGAVRGPMLENRIERGRQSMRDESTVQTEQESKILEAHTSMFLGKWMYLSFCKEFLCNEHGNYAQHARPDGKLNDFVVKTEL